MKVLIVSHTYPPSPGVGGRRIKGLKKYLETKGVEVFVVVNKLPSGKKELQENNIFEAGDAPLVVASTPKTQHKIVDALKRTKLFKIFKEFYFLPDKEIRWKLPAYKKAKEIIEKEHITYVITSSLPHVAQFVGAELKKDFPHIKWVGELRDLWSQNHYNNSSYLFKKINEYYEKKTLKATDALVTVSPPLVEDLKKHYQDKKIYSITNGYDPDDKVSTTLDEKFTITYTGILYEGLRDPRIFLGYVKELIDEGSIDQEKIQINFYGPHEVWLEEFIGKSGLNCIRQNGSISHKESLKRQNASQLLLFINSFKTKDVGVYTAKIFEYLNAERPIIAIGNCEGVVEELLHNTQSGYYEKDKEKLKQTILDLYKEFLTKGTVAYKGITKEVESFSYPNMAEKYLNVLNKI